MPGFVPLSLDTPVSAIADAAGLRWDKKFRDGMEKLGLSTAGDLVEHFPHRHEDRSHFDHFPDHPQETPVCLHGLVTDTQTRFVRGKGRRFTEVAVEPPGGSILGNRIACRWFNMPYMSRVFAAGQEVVLYGRPKMSGRRLVMDHPEYEILDESGDDLDAHMGRIIPIYPLASGVGQKALRTLVHRALESLVDAELPDRLPLDAGPFPLARAEAIRTVHYPPDFSRLEPARRFLALEEFTLQQAILLRRRREREDRGGRSHAGPGELLESFLTSLPFEPTGAQRRVIEEVRRDLSAPSPMVRLLQGDVGAGKTLVAAAAILLVVEAGHDAALMAPTQILAEQHFATFSRWFEPLGVTVRLRTGAKEAGGDMPLFDLAGSRGRSGSLVVGTHALLSGKEPFENGLGLAVIDEQHKFGVSQRQALIDQGDAPDLLVMTATPIPRTLTLSFYGDLDVSLLDELPPGRGKIVTGIRLTSQTRDAAQFVAAQVSEGRQAYIVYPLIEESEKTGAGAVTKEFSTWKELLPGIELVLLHGRMTSDEKDAAMETFRSGRAQVLVSTTVIEVGVDVPNANLMLIYNAERFGLAQLHQLRGRIGRGAHKSYCILLCDPGNGDARERLAILEKTRDGFRIAEEDLRQRGPGDVLGTQQSGLPDLRFVDFLGDTALVQEARSVAEKILAREGV